MLGVFINLLYTHTMPNNHYCSTYMLPYPHLMAKHCLKVSRKSSSEARNLPTCGCKSMMDGLTIMLGVFINLLYTYTLPNNHYSTTYMLLHPHLMVKTLPESQQEIEFLSIGTLITKVYVVLFGSCNEFSNMSLVFDYS